MDVKCQQCGVEYDFDDSQVTVEGVTVKCTNCGHIFKVKREVRVVTEPVMEAKAIGGDWMVRQASGNVFTFKELTTLQRWIVERKVTRDDEISKTGKTWKRLGDIAELASFFQVVDDATAKPPVEPVSLQASAALATDPAAIAAYAPTQPPGSVQFAPAQAAPVPAAPAPAVAQPGLAPGAAVTPAQAPGQMMPSQPFMAQPSTPGLQAPLPTDPVMAAPVPAVPAPPSASVDASVAPSTTPPSWVGPAVAPVDDDDLDEEDPVRNWRRRRRLPSVLLALLLIAAVGVGALALLDRPTFDAALAKIEDSLRGPIPAEVSQAVDQAQIALRRGVASELAQASEACRRAIEKAPDRAEPYAALALTAVGLAESEREFMELSREGLQALTQAHPDGFEEGSEVKQEAARLKADAERAADAASVHYKSAVNAVEEALKLDQSSALVNLAAAEYYRSKGAIDRMQQHLDLVVVAGKPLDQSVRMNNTLAKLEAGQPSPELLTELKALVDEDPKLGRVGYRLLRAQQASGDLDGAKATASALLAQLPGHERAKSWLEAQAQSDAQADAPPEEEKPQVGPTPAPGKEPSEETEQLGFDALISKADRLRDRGQSSQAILLYNRAASIEPRRAEPRAGQGWCYLDMDQSARALGSFQSALEANPSYADAHMGLGETYRARGNNEKAVKHYKRYLDILPGGREANIARRYVEELAPESAPEAAPEPSPAPSIPAPTAPAPQPAPTLPTAAPQPSVEPEPAPVIVPAPASP